MINHQDIKRLALRLERDFTLFNEGPSQGKLKQLGRGEHNRTALPHDDARYLDHAANARSGTGEMFVQLRQNEYFRSGVILSDLSPLNEWGGHEALETRLDVIRDVSAMVSAVLASQGHETGMVLPGTYRHMYLRPGTQANRIIRELYRAQPEVDFLRSGLELVSQQARKLEYVVVVSSLLDPQWDEHLQKIGRFAEVVAIQVLDTWDEELPNLHRSLNIMQDGQIVRRNTGKQAVRDQFRKDAAKRQADIQESLAKIGGHHHVIYTNKPALEQFVQEFSLRNRRRVA